jgi:hypothetical protein
MGYIHTLKRYGAVTRAYFRANDAYVARPVRVRRFADDFVNGQWHVEYGRYLIRRRQILTACRLLGVDSREISF